MHTDADSLHQALTRTVDTWSAEFREMHRDRPPIGMCVTSLAQLTADAVRAATPARQKELVDQFWQAFRAQLEGASNG